MLWRPLHEAEGGWFWWGSKGPETYKQLWRLLFDRLTNYHHLHNLIWVCSSGTDPAWYPGDDVVDIVGVDIYPPDTSASTSETWEILKSQHNGRKLLALTEFGGAPDVAKMRRFGVNWSYFVSWSGAEGPKKVTKEHLRLTYQSGLVITHNELKTGQSRR